MHYFAIVKISANKLDTLGIASTAKFLLSSPQIDFAKAQSAGKQLMLKSLKSIDTCLDKKETASYGMIIVKLNIFLQGFLLAYPKESKIFSQKEINQLLEINNTILITLIISGLPQPLQIAVDNHIKLRDIIPQIQLSYPDLKYIPSAPRFFNRDYSIMSSYDSLMEIKWQNSDEMLLLLQDSILGRDQSRSELRQEDILPITDMKVNSLIDSVTCKDEVKEQKLNFLFTESILQEVLFHYMEPLEIHNFCQALDMDEKAINAAKKKYRDVLCTQIKKIKKNKLHPPLEKNDRLSHLLELYSKVNENANAMFSKAVENGDFWLVCLALYCGADVNYNPKKALGVHSLIDAIRRGYVEIVRLLLCQRTIDVNATTYLYGTCATTALKSATEGENSEIFKLLLTDPRVDISTKGSSGPLCTAIEHNKLERVRLFLVKPGISLDFALVTGVLKSRTKILKFLLTQSVFKARINETDSNKCTGLFLAARQGNDKIVSLLLNIEDIDVNRADFFGRTPLIIAAIQGHTKIIKLLLNKNGDSCLADCLGRTALMLAKNGETRHVLRIHQKEKTTPSYSHSLQTASRLNSASVFFNTTSTLLLLSDIPPAMRNLLAPMQSYAYGLFTHSTCREKLLFSRWVKILSEILIAPPVKNPEKSVLEEILLEINIEISSPGGSKEYKNALQKTHTNILSYISPLTSNLKVGEAISTCSLM